MMRIRKASLIVDLLHVFFSSIGTVSKFDRAESQVVVSELAILHQDGRGDSTQPAKRSSVVPEGLWY